MVLIYVCLITSTLGLYMLSLCFKFTVPFLLAFPPFHCSVGLIGFSSFHFSSASLYSTYSSSVILVAVLNPVNMHP